MGCGVGGRGGGNVKCGGDGLGSSPGIGSEGKRGGSGISGGRVGFGVGEGTGEQLIGKPNASAQVDDGDGFGGGLGDGR